MVVHRDCHYTPQCDRQPVQAGSLEDATLDLGLVVVAVPGKGHLAVHLVDLAVDLAVDPAVDLAVDLAADLAVDQQVHPYVRRRVHQQVHHQVHQVLQALGDYG